VSPIAYDETLRSISLDADETIGFYTGVPGMRGSLDPNGGKQYYFVDITGPHQAGLAGAGGDAVGVLQNKPQHPGEAATVAIAGVSYVIAGGLLEAGDSVSSAADGRGIKSTGTNTALGRVIIGADDGEIAVVLLRMN
jgi:catechol 2,3-dioxygenase-like lactoylglutathione lyase family enzyme